MRLSQEYKIASELREKVHLAEDQLRNEKKNLFKAQAHFSEEREKWSAEIAEKEMIISSNEAEIREKEAKYKEIKDKCNEISQRTTLIEAENEALRKELQRLKLQKDDDMCKYLVEEGNLELELAKIQEWRKEVKVSQKWKNALLFGNAEEGFSSGLTGNSSQVTVKNAPDGELTTETTTEGTATRNQDMSEKVECENEEKEEKDEKEKQKEKQNEKEKEKEKKNEKEVEKKEQKKGNDKKKKEESREVDEEMAFMDKLQ